jgi:hypothetical protein
MAQLPTQSQFGDYGEWPGRDVLDSDGERLGGVREIYLDRETGRPEWVLVDLEGDEARFVPLADAEVADATIRVAHSAATIRKAPGIGTEPRIDQSEERKLYEHYGIGYSTEASASGLPAEEPETVEQEAVEPPSLTKPDEEPEAAPPPPEPPSPDEIERAEKAEPPAATEPEVITPSAAGLSAEPEEPVTPVAAPVPPPESPLISPAATSEPYEEPATPPPPPEPESGGPLDAVKENKAGVAIGVAIAAVLLLLIRKLR